MNCTSNYMVSCRMFQFLHGSRSGRTSLFNLHPHLTPTILSCLLVSRVVQLTLTIWNNLIFYDFSAFSAFETKQRTIYLLSSISLDFPARQCWAYSQLNYLDLPISSPHDEQNVFRWSHWRRRKLAVNTNELLIIGCDASTFPKNFSSIFVPQERTASK